MRNTAAIGTISGAAQALAMAVSLSGVEAWMRVASLAVGIAVGILTGMVMWKRWKQKQIREWDDDGE